MLTHVLDHVLQVLDALPCRGKRQLGRVELLLHITGAQAEFEPATGQIAQGGDVASEQRRLVETRIEDERSEPQGARCGRGHRQRRERCRHAEVVGYVQHVVSEAFDAPREFLDRRL